MVSRQAAVGLAKRASKKKRPVAEKDLLALKRLALLETRPTAWVAVLAPMPARAPHSDSPQRVLNRQLKRGPPS